MKKEYDNDFVDRLFEFNKRARQERIDGWKKYAKPPILTLKNEDDIVMGYWNTTKGVLRIPRSKNGEYDPINASLFSLEELETIKAVASCEQIEVE